LDSVEDATGVPDFNARPDEGQYRNAKPQAEFHILSAHHMSPGLSCVQRLPVRPPRRMILWTAVMNIIKTDELVSDN